MSIANALGLRPLFVSSCIVAAICLPGCRVGEVDFDLGRQKVDVFKPVKAEDRSGTELSSDEDGRIAAAFPLVQSEDRYYRFDPPITSGDISLNSVKWTPRQTVLNVSSASGRELTLIDNSTYCASRTFFIFCTEYWSLAANLRADLRRPRKLVAARPAVLRGQA